MGGVAGIGYLRDSYNLQTGKRRAVCASEMLA